MTTKLFLSGILFVLLACNDDSIDSFVEIDNTPQYLVRSWTHSYMEGCWHGGPLTFKPSEDADFTSFRFRNKLDVHADGSVTYKIASPPDPNWNENGNTVTGTWVYDPIMETFMIVDDGVVAYSFLIMTSTEDKLKMCYKKTKDVGLPK